MEIAISSFYKYVNIEDVEEFQKRHLGYCKELGIKGKVLVGNEGINGTVSGTQEQVEKYEKALINNKLFRDITFKRSISTEHPFKKTIVRIRDEIVSSGINVNMNNTGIHLSPKELKEALDNGEDLILLDARNNYESKIGRFKGAITPDIEIFRDFPKVAEQIKDLKDKKIVMYCTGGIRCEKASAYLKEKGFKNVYQIKDGILNYIEQYPDSYFEGRCFVFDDRLSVPSGKNTKDITVCEKCHIPSGQYVNCSNAKCNYFYICCEDCWDKSGHTCSKECRGIIETKTAMKDVTMKSKRFNFKDMTNN